MYIINRLFLVSEILYNCECEDRCSYPIKNVTGVQRKLDMVNQVSYSLNMVLFFPPLSH